MKLHKSVQAGVERTLLPFQLNSIMSNYALCHQETVCRLHARNAGRRQCLPGVPKLQKTLKSTLSMATQAPERAAVNGNGKVCL